MQMDGYVLPLERPVRFRHGTATSQRCDLLCGDRLNALDGSYAGGAFDRVDTQCRCLLGDEDTKPIVGQSVVDGDKHRTSPRRTEQGHGQGGGGHVGIEQVRCGAWVGALVRTALA